MVKAMLITGFDAPIVQVQYLDRASGRPSCSRQSLA
jgi:hypothetical protein